MPSFKNRSTQKELLDADAIPFADIKRNMEELDFINRNLGGHAITLQGLKMMLPNAEYLNEPLQVVEIGCGGGDNLRAVKAWAKKMNLPVQLTGIDLNEECIHFAKQQPRNKGISFLCSDYKAAVFHQKPHIIFSSLFCHHFTDTEMVFQLRWMKQNSSVGFFINDLHRHRLAYYSIALLTRFFSRSYLVKNDAPVSVLRGFIKKEWTDLLNAAGIEEYGCQWRWAFRWLITCVNSDHANTV